MKRMQSLMAGVLGAGAVVAGAGAQFNSEFSPWGNNAFGQCNIPAGVQLTSIAAGNLHCVGLTADGYAIAWGSNANQQCDVPAGLADVARVAAGGWYQVGDQRGHSAALLRNGTVRAWGSNEYGQCDVPSGLAGVTQIACGWAHTVALDSTGTVVVWGAGDPIGADPHWGQRTVPADLGVVSSVSTKGCHIMARLADGTVRCWGRNQEGQCTLPPKLGQVLQIAAGSDHSVALLPSGQVRCWGWNEHGQSTIPQALGAVREVAATMYGTIALLESGTIASWGLIAQAPEMPTRVEHLSAGGYHAVAQRVRDCNANGIIDSIELQTQRAFDSDADGLLDQCDGADPLPVLTNIVVTRGTVGPSYWPLCGAWDTRTQSTDYLWDLWVSRTAADGPWLNRLNAPAENPFRLNGTLQQGLNTLYCRFEQNGCSESLFTANLWLDEATLPCISVKNSTPIEPIAGLIPGLNPGVAISAANALEGRSGTWRVRIAGFSIEEASDMVAPVDFAPSNTPDLLATIVIEVTPACPGDVSQNGIVDGVDLAAVLGAWGTSGHGEFECDIDRDGVVSGSDLAQVLGSWGPCQ